MPVCDRGRNAVRYFVLCVFAMDQSQPCANNVLTILWRYYTLSTQTLIAVPSGMKGFGFAMGFGCRSAAVAVAFCQTIRSRATGKSCDR